MWFGWEIIGGGLFQEINSGRMLVDDFYGEDGASFLDVLVVLVVIDEEWRARIPGKAFLREVGLILGARRT